MFGVVSARDIFHRDRRQVPSSPSSLSAYSSQGAHHRQSHLLVLRILFVSSQKRVARALLFWAAFLSHTWCEAICAPDPRASFVIHVHLRGLLSCRGGTFVCGAILLFGSSRSHVCDSYESGSRCCFTRVTRCLVVIGHRSANSAYWMISAEWRSLSCLLTTGPGVGPASTRLTTPLCCLPQAPIVASVL